MVYRYLICFNPHHPFISRALSLLIFIALTQQTAIPWAEGQFCCSISFHRAMRGSEGRRQTGCHVPDAGYSQYLLSEL